MLKTKLTQPLIDRGAEGVAEVVELMEQYGLTREVRTKEQQTRFLLVVFTFALYNTSLFSSVSVSSSSSYRE